MSLRLIIEDDEGTTTIVPLGKDAITIGRQQGNTIQLIEKNVSRRHARLFLDDAELWILEDLGSYNGIKVNGVAIEAQVKLKEGDVVQIGDYHLALTEDVDKRTLNYSGAANDPGAPPGVEPMLASSSNELQSLSADELAMIQSGPHGVAGTPPMMLDSGAMPAVTPGAGAYDERRKGGAGFLVGFGAVVLLALIVGVVWLASSGGDDAAPGQQVAAKAGTPPTAPAAAPPQPTPPAAADPVVLPPVEPPVEAAAEAGGAEAADPLVEVADAAPDPVVEEPAVIPEAPAPTPPPEATPRKPKSPKRQPRKNGGSSSAAKSSPPKPAVDADALAKEARAAAFGNPRKCFDLAKQSYNAKRNAGTAQTALMCACKIPDAGKAKWAVGKVPPSKRDSLTKVCEKKGIKL